MKQNRRVKRHEIRNDHQSFTEYPLSTKQKEVDLEQLYVVPWELTEDDTKRWSIIH